MKINSDRVNSFICCRINFPHTPLRPFDTQHHSKHILYKLYDATFESQIDSILAFLEPLSILQFT